MRVLAICGSLRRDSLNRALLSAAAELFPPAAGFELYESLKELPPYDEDDDIDPVPAAVARLRAALAGADALLIATPEYNASLPGQLKNALDWASRPFPENALKNLPVAVVGASTSAFGAVWAQAEARKVLAAAGARVLEEQAAAAHADRLFASGRLDDADVWAALATVVSALTEAARARSAAAVASAIAPISTATERFAHV